jgi:hypothetical protein
MNAAVLRGSGLSVAMPCGESHTGRGRGMARTLIIVVVALILLRHFYDPGPGLYGVRALLMV